MTAPRRLWLTADRSRVVEDGTGGWVRKDGYIGIYFPKHPDAAPSSGFIMEHRLVMERVLGRRLLRSEQVHHINGERHDNRPENLQILSPGDHARVSNARGKAKRQSLRDELAEYRRRFGPLT